MKKLLYVLTVIAICGTVAYAQQFKKVKEVIGSGGADASGGAFHMQGTIGQAIIGPTSGSSNVDYQGFWTPGITDTSLGVEIGVTGPPAEYDLLQNYPNPFNPTTTIKFSVPARTHVMLRIFSMTGTLVKTLIDENYAAGSYSVVFTANEFPTGPYLYTLDAGGHTMTKRMILIK